jgi:hypothetical protein
MIAVCSSVNRALSLAAASLTSIQLVAPPNSHVAAK